MSARCRLATGAVAAFLVGLTACDQSPSLAENEQARADERSTEDAKTDAAKTDGEPVEDDRPKDKGQANKDKPSNDKDPPKDNENDPDKPADNYPFAQRVDAPSLDGGVAWINTSGPIDLKELRGKFVILDFWTYCCINCMHVLPELKKVEKAYPKNVVVIGVHSAKFDTEKDSRNITEAVLRYEIEHPVINDANQVIWRKYFATGWPALRIIDPEGNLVVAEGGEIPFEAFDAFFKQYIPKFRERGTLDETPLHFDVAARKTDVTPLRFPGKVLADEAGGRLFISDSNHNRIVITNLAGKLLEIIGSGQIGAADGDYAKASFDHLQGLALTGQTLYVADTENHLLRKIDLKSRRVTTIAGTGMQGRTAWPGLEKLDRDSKLPDRWIGKPPETALNSPWALWVHGDSLFIAMAGPHQIWKMKLDESEIGPYAGNGREDIVDGPLLPERPHELGFASFAQPSGLTSDGQWLYVADSEGSSIRAVPLDGKGETKTIVGTAHLRDGRLFQFGDQDGEKDAVRLQHALGVTYHDGALYIADTYNNKIKIIDPKKRTAETIAGTGKPGKTDDPATFDEPAGIAFAKGQLYIADTNNHRIRTIDLANGYKVGTLNIEGLQPPKPAAAEAAPSFKGATEVAIKQAHVKLIDKKITVRIELKLPVGWKINEQAPSNYYVEAGGDTGPVDRKSLRVVTRSDKPAARFEFTLPVTAAEGQDTLKVLHTFYYCQEGERGLCKVGQVVWTVPIKVDADSADPVVSLKYEVK